MGFWKERVVALGFSFPPSQYLRPRSESAFPDGLNFSLSYKWWDPKLWRSCSIFVMCPSFFFVLRDSAGCPAHWSVPRQVLCWLVNLSGFWSTQELHSGSILYVSDCLLLTWYITPQRGASLVCRTGLGTLEPLRYRLNLIRRVLVSPLLYLVCAFCLRMLLTQFISTGYLAQYI